MDPRPNPHYSPETSVKANQFRQKFILFVPLVLRNGPPANSAGHSLEFRHHAHRFGGQTSAWFEGRKSLRHTVTYCKCS